MYNELRKKAEKRVQAKMGFYVCAIVFTFTTAILLGLSFYIPAIVFWLMLPIPVFMMVLAILYLSAFGSPSTVTLSEDWKEEEIEKEMIRLYQQKKLQSLPLEDLSQSESLELKELERLEEKWGRDEDYV
ncbi:MAG: 2TM domain-containing protein [Chitinophagales bacterium]|nr:2TM domain-containing protein [Chitinophagales bacterium]